MSSSSHSQHGNGDDGDHSSTSTLENSNNTRSESSSQTGLSSNATFRPTFIPNKFNASDTELTGLLENNRRWADSINTERPEFFATIALKQEPKVLWIGCADSRVPANEIVQLGPGEVFVHRNIANVVVHTDLNCLSVVQYAVEILRVEHIIICGHYRCGGVATSMRKQQFGLIDNWLRNIKDVYRSHRQELEAIKDVDKRERRLVELNVDASARNVAHSTIVQNAWAKGQRLLIHGWVYDLETGYIKTTPLCIKCGDAMEDIYNYEVPIRKP